MSQNWDLDNWDDYEDWFDGAREIMRSVSKEHMIGRFQDRAWAELDEPRYLAALLYAGVEPSDEQHEEHGQWQDRIAYVLMQKHIGEWWWAHEVWTHEYRRKARRCRQRVRMNELREFYAWLCNQRGESWTSKIVPK